MHENDNDEFPKQPMPVNVRFSPEQAQRIIAVRRQLIELLGAPLAAAAANVLAAGFALERGITVEQHTEELAVSRRVLETLNAGGGSA